MTLPPLPAIPVPPSPDGFQTAIRNAARRRWHRAGGAAGALVAVAVALLAVPGGHGTSGLQPVRQPVTRTPSASPAGVPTGTVAPPGPADGEPAGTGDVTGATSTPSVTQDPGASPGPAATPAVTPAPTPTPAVSNPPLPLYRRQVDEEDTGLCLDDSDETPGEEGTRYGEWCLIASSGMRGHRIELRLTACPLTPTAPTLVPAEAREVDFEVWAKETRLFTSYPARYRDPQKIERVPGQCTQWTYYWPGRTDTGEEINPQTYTLTAILRLTGETPADSVPLTLS
jgi:hypothetical protein